VSTIVHLLLAVVLTLFLAFQATSLVFVVRYRRARIASRPPGRADLLWTCIPIVIVLFLAARSWVAAFDLERPAAASAITQAELGGGLHRTAPRH
jgi:heme/copper-type cytochrome/quinol oxidase subunit 2